MNASPPLHILLEDNHLLVVNKPAGLPTMGVAAGRPSLITLAKQYIKTKYDKPGNVYLGIVSRLDAPVTGGVVVRTSKSASRISNQFRTGAVEKVYWAVVDGVPEPTEAQCIDWLRKDERHRRVHVVSSLAHGGQEARLRYRLLRRLGKRSLLEVHLETGRKHQIRVQLAHLGFPVLGDRKYGNRNAFADGIALHCRSLALTHPVRKTPLSIVAPLPDSWQQFRLQE